MDMPDVACILGLDGVGEVGGEIKKTGGGGRPTGGGGLFVSDPFSVETMGSGYGDATREELPDLDRARVLEPRFTPFGDFSALSCFLGFFLRISISAASASSRSAAVLARARCACFGLRPLDE